MELNVENAARAELPSAAMSKERLFTRIEPSVGWAQVNFRELWAYRELLYFFTWRDIKVRYKQTALGASWAVIQPFLTMVVFTLVFGRGNQVAKSWDGPYPVWSFVALVPWFFFAGGLTGASLCVVSNAGVVKKVFFPRLMMPISTILSNLTDFVIAFAVLLLMMLHYRIMPTINVIWLPAFVLLAFITALGVGLWAAAINVRYRDVKYTITFLTQFWMFATPIIWDSRKLNEPLNVLYGLNPMAGVVEGFRWALLGPDTAPAPGLTCAISVVVAVGLLVSGVVYFSRMEKTFADIV